MKFNFNEKVDRSKNHAAKWEEMGKKFGSDDLLPMWIADMDIKTVPEVVEAIKEKADQAIFGYVYRPDSYYETAAQWLEKRFGYKINPKTLIHSPGVVPSMNMLVKSLTKEDEKVLIQTPVYPPFAESVKNGKRTLVTNELVKDENGYYTMDFEDLERKLSDEKVTLFILCSPHNPVGRVWKKEELEKVGELCLKYNVRILADEIWRDLVLPGHTHTPIASISKEIEDITITCFSPTKTFNIAGLQASFATFPREEEWKAFDTELGEMDIKRNNPFSLVGFEAAYKHGEEWLSELLEHLDGNAQYVVDFIKERIPEIKTFKPEGTYLMWLDFNGLNLTPAEITDMLLKDAKVAMNDGAGFGANGTGFARLNIACPRYMVEDAMERIEKAVRNIKK
ncbi:pyridoxal phosphate-dependent aminotransferase [Fusobacterium perfoetens]|uniref:MalY/PatB family protein n=1 Tax=Fusobacterium perfoetens TaxID=852 RepID=UPI001F352360|nr:MalY/PatB family protein [Fusobacterium perfoetens]MCF2625787.1 pyridoxal phosphate-dependent aminotransferase [Fusobacterium perfoetens]